MKGCRSQPTLFPGHVHFKSTAGAQTLDRTLGPGIGQRGEQFNRARVTLQKHLRDGGRDAKISVNLKWRAGIEEVRINSAAAVVTDFQPAHRSQRLAHESVRAI